AGGKIDQATLLYDADHDKLAVMRSKEHAHDYRYFPEPDLPVLAVAGDWIERVRAQLPELPWARRERLAAHYGIPAYDAGGLSESAELADYFESTAALVDAKKASNWIMGEALRHVKAKGLTIAEWARRVPPAHLARVVEAVQSVTITAQAGKAILEQVAESGA